MTQTRILLIAGLILAGCGATPRAPQRCRNLVQNPGWENRASGWNAPAFAKWEPGSAEGVASFVIEGTADGAIAQEIARPVDLAGVEVIAVGYARVETAHALDPTDEDATAKLWDGTVNLVNGWSKNGRDFPGPYTRLRFSGREVASGLWKRFVTPAIPAGRARVLYPHFAFWGARLAPGVKLHVAAVALVEAPASGANGDSEPESWAECPNLPAPAVVLESATERQWKDGLEPNGSFEDSFIASEGPASSGRRPLRLMARYRQGSLPADRFVVAVTEDGSDPRLSPTSTVVTVLARRGAEGLETAVQVKTGARPVRVAVAAAVLTAAGLRPQTPLLPVAWQKP